MIRMVMNMYSKMASLWGRDIVEDYVKGRCKMRTFDDMLSKQLQDEEFRKEYETIQPELDVIRAIVDARTSQNMTLDITCYI